jgi:hypothetical protein
MKQMSTFIYIQLINISKNIKSQYVSYTIELTKKFVWWFLHGYYEIFSAYFNALEFLQSLEQ